MAGPFFSFKTCAARRNERGPQAEGAGRGYLYDVADSIAQSRGWSEQRAGRAARSPPTTEPRPRRGGTPPKAAPEPTREGGGAIAEARQGCRAEAPGTGQDARAPGAAKPGGHPRRKPRHRTRVGTADTCRSPGRRRSDADRAGGGPFVPPQGPLAENRAAPQNEALFLVLELTRYNWA